MCGLVDMVAVILAKRLAACLGDAADLVAYPAEGDVGIVSAMDEVEGRLVRDVGHTADETDVPGASAEQSVPVGRGFGVHWNAGVQKLSLHMDDRLLPYRCFFLDRSLGRDRDAGPFPGGFGRLDHSAGVVDASVEVGPMLFLSAAFRRRPLP